MAGVGAVAKGLLILRSQCPFCRRGNFRQARTEGLWEQSLLPLVGIRPHLCEDCHGRFLRFSLHDNPPAKVRLPKRKREHPLGRRGSAVPAGQKAFHELIAEIAEAERVRFGAPDPDLVRGSAKGSPLKVGNDVKVSR